MKLKLAALTIAVLATSGAFAQANGMKLLGVQRHPLGQWRGQGDRRREKGLQIKLQRR